MASKITGKFSVDDLTFRFSAIAFGRIGGQNIGAKISKSTEKKLSALGYNTDEIIIELQKNLVHGNLDLPKGLRKESFADD